MVIVFILSAIFFCLPLVLRKFLKKNEQQMARLTSILNCLSGGVFFGTLTLNVWPSAIHEFSHVLEELSISIEYPLASLLITVGFFLIVIIEDLCEYLDSKNSSNKNLIFKNILFILNIK